MLLVEVVGQMTKAKHFPVWIREHLSKRGISYTYTVFVCERTSLWGI
jgi:hypothetical protein